MQATALRSMGLALARQHAARAVQALPRAASPGTASRSVTMTPIRVRSRTFHSSFRRRDAHSSAPPPPPAEPQGAYAKFRALTKKYGWYAAGMYTFLSAIDFSLCFLGVHAAGLERIDPYWRWAVREFRVVRHGAEAADELERQDERDKAEAKEQERRDKEAGVVKKKDNNAWGSKKLWAEIALAYAIHKTALLPLRAGITVAVTPKFVNWLAARGWVGKGGITRAATHAQGKVRNASDKVRDRVKTLRD